ncbi:MAG: nucleotide exchange factor GrpE [Bacteroidaceae bacterium]|nr:nucleotide exchange factor GrpE [Bacteroidaceae bacterium]
MKENQENLNEEEVLNEETVQQENTNSDASENQEETASEGTEKKQEEDDSLEAQLAKAQAQVEEYKDKYLRQLAEFDNYRRRVIKEKADLIKNGGEKVISAILPILDDFDRANETLGKMGEGASAEKKGVELIIEKFVKILKQQGLEKMDVVGKPFDVDFHEAVAMVPGQPDELKGKVIDCVLAGYMLNEKVIRHAKVAIAQ